MFKLSYSTNGLTKLDLFKAFSEVEKSGYEGVELSFQYKQFDPFELTEENLLEIKKYFTNSTIRPVCISTATTFFLSDIPHEPSLISLDICKRKQRIELIKKGIDIAKTIGVPIVSFQSGYLREEHLQNPLIDPMQLLVEGIKMCLENIEDIVLVIEPEPGMFIETLDDAISLIEEVNSTNFKLHLDIGHAFCTENDYVNSIAKAIPYIEYMHLADIKQGYNLKYLSLPTLTLNALEINLDFAGYLIKIPEKNDYIFIDKKNCIYFYSNELNPTEKEEISQFVHIIKNDSLIVYKKTEEIQELSNEDMNINSEIKAFLDSIAGIRFDELKKAEPILRYLRSKQGKNEEPLINKPICNTIKGKVHFHEFPGQGEIDFTSVLTTLIDNNYNGFVTVELYNHTDIWDSVLSASREYLLNCVKIRGEIK